MDIAGGKNWNNPEFCMNVVWFPELKAGDEYSPGFNICPIVVMM